MAQLQSFYKIRNKDGKFSTGGERPQWTKSGKTWAGLGPLKNHLNCVEEAENRYNWKRSDGYDKVFFVYEDCEIVRFEMQVEETDTCLITQFLAVKQPKDIFIKLEEMIADNDTTTNSI